MVVVFFTVSQNRKLLPPGAW